MRALLFLVCLFCTTATVNAEQILINTNGAAPGTYYLVLTIAADGTATLTRMDVKVFNLTNGDDNNGPPPPPPQNRFFSLSKSALQEVTDPNKDVNRVGVAQIYEEAAALPFDRGDQVKKATDIVYTGRMSAKNLEEPWKPWKDKIDREVGFVLTGRPVDEWKRAWLEIARGLKAED